MWTRMTIAVTALVSGMVALYLHFIKLGLAGNLSCGLGQGCNQTIFGPYGWFPVPNSFLAQLGIPVLDVALIGALGYAAILVAAFISTSERLEFEKWPTVLLTILIAGGMLFTLRLKYYEFFVLRTFCPWCAVSAVTITLQSVLVSLDWRRLRMAQKEALDSAS